MRSGYRRGSVSPEESGFHPVWVGSELGKGDRLCGDSVGVVFFRDIDCSGLLRLLVDDLAILFFRPIPPLAHRFFDLLNRLACQQ